MACKVRLSRMLSGQSPCRHRTSGLCCASHGGPPLSMRAGCGDRMREAGGCVAGRQRGSCEEEGTPPCPSSRQSPTAR